MYILCIYTYIHLHREQWLYLAFSPCSLASPSPGVHRMNDFHQFRMASRTIFRWFFSDDVRCFVFLFFWGGLGSKESKVIDSDSPILSDSAQVMGWLSRDSSLWMAAKSCNNLATMGILMKHWDYNGSTFIKKHRTETPPTCEHNQYKSIWNSKKMV